jgi:hypothetical protein
MTTIHNKSNPNIHLTLDEVGERVLALEKQSTADAYQIGWHYNYVVDRELWKSGGYKDAPDFFQKRVKVISQATLSTYGAVARSFTAAATVKYGMYHLYTLLTYEKLAGIQADGEEPGPTPILVPKEDGTLEQKPFAGCTVEELKRAVKAKRRTPPTPLPESATSRVEFYRGVLDRHFTKDSHIRVSARVERGKLLISLRDFPDEQLPTLIEALMDSLKPVREAA